MLIAWRPVEKGVLAQTGISTVDEMCKKYGKTPVQIAINWLISQANVVTLSKTSALDHLKENLGGIDWEMEDKDVERIRNEFPSQKKISNRVPLG
jgi:diketogulonate reductase-like aldo/keto reductase